MTVRDIELARDIALKVVTEAGLTVNHGEVPTEEQVRLAALHAREDAALCAAMLGMLLSKNDTAGDYARRAARAIWWLGLVLAFPTFGLAILVLWPISYVLGGSFWTPPRA
jgi:hypothetical protein